MSPVQWMFHYKECILAEQKKAKEQKALMQILEVYSFYSHPKIDLQKMLRAMEDRRLRENAPEMQKELEADYDLAKTILPTTLSVQVEETNDEQKPLLPLAKKKKRSKNRLKKKDL